MTRVAMTTVDNPFDVFDQFNDWFVYDSQQGHNTCGLLDRVMGYSDAISDTSKQRTIEEAIDFVIEIDNGVKFVKVSR